jgi:hypothetical protein
MAHGQHDLTEFEWKTIQPLLLNKSRGVPRVDAAWSFLNSPTPKITAKVSNFAYIYARLARMGRDA